MHLNRRGQPRNTALYEVTRQPRNTTHSGAFRRLMHPTRTMNAHKIKQDICEIGRRIYAKGFAAANDGNITVRIGENEVLCTPTMHCKGFLKPEDISTIDMTGKQL